MSMIEEGLVPCVIMQKVRVPDGEGGFITTWTEGAEFRAAITFNGSTLQKIADTQGNHSAYKITAPKSADLDVHDVVKRLSDGKIFRVTSESKDMETPARARFGQYCQADAESWVIPS